MKRYTTDTELKNKYKDLETEDISEESEREAEEDMSRARTNGERKRTNVKESRNARTAEQT